MKVYYLIFITVVQLLSQIAFAQNNDATDIMMAVEKRDVGQDERADVLMLLIDADGEKRERKLIRLRCSEGREEKVRLQFQFPPDLRDTALLLHDHADRDDDRWLYLPTLRKVKRISGAQKYRNFLGTDFTYDELGGREPEEDIHTLESEEQLDGKAVYRIRSVPKEKENPYEYRLTWVWKNTPVVLKEEYYDRHGRLKKRMQVLKLKTIQNIPTVIKREMVDIPENHRTVLSFNNLKYNTGVSSRLLHPRKLNRPVK